MIWFIQLMVMAVILPITLLTHLVPPLFHLFAWLTRYLFAVAYHCTGRTLSHGALILLAAGIWGGAALLFLPWVQMVLPSTTAFWLLVIVGGLWGLCVGHQAALLWQAELLRLPDTDTRHLFDLPPHHFQSNADPRAAQDRNESEEPGIGLGYTDDFTDLYDTDMYDTEPRS